MTLYAALRIKPALKPKKPNKHASALGKMGKGKAKARTSDQARAAVMKRWEKTK